MGSGLKQRLFIRKINNKIYSAGARELEAPKYIMGSEGETLSGIQGQSPGQGDRGLKAETLLAFGRLLKAANLPTFKKIGNAKNQIQFVLSLKK